MKAARHKTPRPKCLGIVLLGFGARYSHEVEFLTHLPAPFEQIFENFTADPSVVSQRIASLVREAATFERFDLMRVDPILRKYTYEYSIG